MGRLLYYSKSEGSVGSSKCCTRVRLACVGVLRTRSISRWILLLFCVPTLHYHLYAFFLKVLYRGSYMPCLSGALQYSERLRAPTYDTFDSDTGRPIAACTVFGSRNKSSSKNHHLLQGNIPIKAKQLYDPQKWSCRPWHRFHCGELLFYFKSFQCLS